MQVGAVNCVKHAELCRSIPVPSYPTLVAINSPGEPRGTADKPAAKVMGRGKKKFEDVMSLIEAEFPGAADGTGVAAAPRVLEQNKRVAVGDVADGAGEAGAPCALRIEDAAMSVRFNLKYEVFTQGPKLTRDQMGECELNGPDGVRARPRCREAVLFAVPGTNCSDSQDHRAHG